MGGQVIMPMAAASSNGTMYVASAYSQEESKDPCAFASCGSKAKVRLGLV